MKIIFEYSPWLLIPIALLAVVIAMILYHKDKTFVELAIWKKRLLTAFRAAFIFLTLALLLNPIVKHISHEIQKPIIVLAQDNSKSLLYCKDSVFYTTEYKQRLDDFCNDLSHDYEVCLLPFSNNVEESDSVDFLGEATNISSVFNEVGSRFAGANLGAVILASDGIYNKGQNPQYATATKYPIFCIALGDTVSYKDLVIRNITHNSITFLGNKFPVRIQISADRCTEKQALLTIVSEGKKVLSQQVNLSKNGETQYVDVELLAEEIGLQRYSISLEKLEGEANYDNNCADFFIEVIDKREKIVFVANAPHPDLGAMMSALKTNPDFEIDIIYPFSKNQSVKDYDLVITHQIPAVENSMHQIFAEINKYSKSHIAIIGRQTSLKDFDMLSLGLNLGAKQGSYDEAVPCFNPQFNSFNVEQPEFLQSLAPLTVPYCSPKISTESKVLLYQIINNIKTNKPLIFFTEENNSKRCFILGEGLWRWRISDFKQNSSCENFNSLINKIVRYTITKQQKDKLLVNSKSLYNDNENVVITAEFYNEAYELVQGLDIEAVVVDSSKHEFKYKMEAVGSAYRLDLGKLGSGNYICKFNTTFDSKDYVSTKAFIVRKINIEAQNLTADHNVLYKIANNNGGKMYYPSNFESIKDELAKNPNIQNLAYETEEMATIKDFWYLFVVILLFASVEWFLRKFWGGY